MKSVFDVAADPARAHKKPTADLLRGTDDLIVMRRSGE
jgi:hypothetical protein